MHALVRVSLSLFFYTQASPSVLMNMPPASLFSPSFLFVDEKKYEEKRQRYLVAKGATTTSKSTSEKATVQFELGQAQNVVPREPQPTDEANRSNGPSYGYGDVKYQEEVAPQGREYSRRKPSIAALDDVSSPDLRRPNRQEIGEQNPTATRPNPKTEYARQLREQMAANAAAAERARNNAHRPVAAAAAPMLMVSGGDREGGGGGGGGGDGAAGDDGGAAVDRKAEYALQLREQMAANEAARRAAEKERKSAIAPVPPPSVSGSKVAAGEIEVVGPAVDTKAEYARQLREQIKAKENARQITQDRGEHSSNGPAWLEGATEGRQKHRRKSNAEYAEQLRAQIAAQRTGVEQKSTEQSHMALRASGMHENGHHALDSEEQRQQQRQGPRVTNSAEHGIIGPHERHHRSRGNQEGRVEGEADIYLDRRGAGAAGERAGSPQRGAQRSSALER